MIPQVQRLVDSIQDQVWFQQLRAKWDELDSQSKLYLQWASASGGILLLAWIFFGTLWKVHGLKREIQERGDLIRIVQMANEEMGELKGQIPRDADKISASPQPLKDYFTTLASSANVPNTTLELTNEKVGSTREGSKETLAQINLKKVNLNQLVRFIFQIENGSRPVKLRNMSVEAHSDESGYLDATLFISSFTLKPS